LTRYSIEHTYCRYAVFKVRAPRGGYASGAGRVLPGRRSLKAEQHDHTGRSSARHEPLEWMRCARASRAVPGRRHCSRASLARPSRGAGELDGVPRDSGAQVALSATP